MIRLTRFRHSEPFFVNPDHIERIEHHHDVHVHLFNGTEFVVTESPDEIVERVLDWRARILAVASRLSAQEPASAVEGAA